MKLLLCRTIILYLCVLFAMRLMGKRQLGELQPEELVSTILISNLASISIESEFDRRNADLIAQQTGTRVVAINPLSYDWEEEMMNTARALVKE